MREQILDSLDAVAEAMERMRATGFQEAVGRHFDMVEAALRPILTRRETELLAEHPSGEPRPYYHFRGFQRELGIVSARLDIIHDSMVRSTDHYQVSVDGVSIWNPDHTPQETSVKWDEDPWQMLSDWYGVPLDPGVEHWQSYMLRLLDDDGETGLCVWPMEPSGFLMVWIGMDCHAEANMAPDWDQTQLLEHIYQNFQDMYVADNPAGLELNLPDYEF